MYKFSKSEVLENGRIQFYSKCKDYLVSKDGKAYSIKSGYIKEMKISNSTLYPSVRISNKGKVKTTNIHRMVAETFLENPDSLECVNHIDGNKQNNNIENLEWCTMQDNLQHAYNTGLNKGKPKKLSKEEIAKVVELHSNGVSMRKIAEQFNTNHCLISRELKQYKGNANV